MLRTRIISAAVAIPVVAVLVYLGDLPFAAAVAVLSVIATAELCRMLRLGAAAPLAPLAIAAAPLYVVDAQWPALGIGRIVLAATVLIGLAWALARPSDPPAAAASWALTVVAPIYGGWLLAFFVLMRAPATGPSLALPGNVSLPSGAVWTALALTTAWACDTAAYLVGRSFGRRPLYPLVSPRKTVEGTAAGLAGATLVGLVWAPAAGVSPLAGLALGLAIGLAGVVGDLSESLLKRAGGVKDSGTLFPGHGGLLDRLDSLLFVAVVVYYAQALLART